jgi:putative ABC transport system permease protein
VISKWVLQSLKNNKKFCLFFILNLSLGLIGFISLDTFKNSLKVALEDNSKNFLSADISLSARRKLTEEEILIAEKVLQTKNSSRLWEFFSMVNSPAGSRLVQVKAIDQKYPFYGELKLGSGKNIQHDSEKEIIGADKIWVYPELLDQLSLKVGDVLSLGEHQYQIADTISDDSTQTFRLSSLAPKIYVDRDSILKSKLIQKGTTYTDALLFKVESELNLKNAKDEIFKLIKDNGVQVTSSEEASQDTARALIYLNDYLGLVSLVALFLSALGASYLFRFFLNSQIKNIAIFNVLGLKLKSARFNIVMQILLLCFLASLLSAALSLLIFPILQNILRDFAPIQVPMKISARIWVLTFIICTIGSLSVSLFYLLKIPRIKTQQLFQEDSIHNQISKRTDYLVVFVPLFLFWLLSLWQANSFKIGTAFVGIMAVSLVLINLIFTFLVKLLSAFSKSRHWQLKYIVLQIIRKKNKSLICVLAISLGSLLINILPQIKKSIEDELESPSSNKLPALFMFDIQDDQIDPLLEKLSLMGFSNLQSSPMIRARILKVNDNAFEKNIDATAVQTREAEAEARFRNRGFNLSYRPQLSDSEELVSGELWTKKFEPSVDQIPEISLEKRFADRLNFKIGDVLVFDVQGVEISGKVTSFRSVKWNSFQPNFFVLFQPGVLEEAPKNFLLSLPKSLTGNPVEIQNEIVKSFPNVSIVDVRRTVEKVINLLRNMSWSLEFMAFICLLVGFIVLFTIIQNQVELSRWDFNLVKILGAHRRQALNLLTIEFALIGFISSLIGCGLSFIMGFFLAHYLFDSVYTIEIFSPVMTVVIVTLASYLLALLTGLKVARQRPQIILQS